MKKGLLISLILFLACGEPEPRRPIKVQSGSFIKESTERNKQLLAQEEKLIQDIIDRDTIHNFMSSADGFWYYYESRSEEESPTPNPDDLVTLSYNVVSFNNDTIYSKENIGVNEYKVDKQALFPGFRSAIKLLKEGETATFLFPSSLGYGYLGDKKKIGVNIPIKSTISIIKIEQAQENIKN